MMDIWHSRMAHAGFRAIKEIFQKGADLDLKMESRVRSSFVLSVLKEQWLTFL